MEKLESRLEDVFSRYERTRSKLVPILQDTQASLGYLPIESLKAIARFLSIPESQVYGVATFYGQFYFSRRGRNEVKVCYGTACHVKGATRLIESFERQLGVSCGSTTDDYEYSLERVACVGCCSLAPVAVINEETHAHLTPDKVNDLIEETRKSKPVSGVVCSNAWPTI
ncbi:MAG: NADP-reducing hydrogenase subunit HndA [candidate division WS2 bacterium]|uniref:NADH-quinone oxidoreductase subunit E n=1 Tax=Candidatus Hakubella thermalkaliphila TaxID=2754717 RepID=A0A6V8PVS1_9ACTN|nr:NADH-quinone oxidoreductase subunit NuoE [Candidatus Hakubella thermalkaliphila]MBT9165142.1 NADP-reducing hydrogenase subunit HndA [Candidatus Lithacetigena glycinireducens]GFP35166.1 NADH-quinone oxidoreductase subunit E [Candidatus Hakubella thermalkaliphila]GFP43296.1 NADH-quinone oxidoreductase subunit E [Candidatus Hakubella thermalkaliphila]